MPKYHCYAEVTGSKYLGVVEAESESEAIENALELGSSYVSLCHECTRECEDPAVTNVSVEKVEEEDES